MSHFGTHHMDAITDIEGWAISPRGAGYLFGGNIVDEVTCLLMSMSCDMHVIVHVTCM